MSVLIFKAVAVGSLLAFQIIFAVCAGSEIQKDVVKAGSGDPFIWIVLCFLVSVATFAVALIRG